MLLGRDVETHAIGALLAGARLSRGGSLLLTGEAGMGKSALLDHAVSQAVGMLVLRATGTESERDLAFAGLAQLLRPVIGDLGSLPPPQALALEVALALRDRGRIERFAVGAATLGLLTHASTTHPVGVFVDDAHLLDRPSQEAISFAARRLLVDPICMLVAARPGHDSVLTAAGLPELRLSGLSVADVAALTEATAGVPLPIAVRERIAELSAGNPLAVRELARDATALVTVPPGSALPLPATLADIFARRADDISPAARDLLALAAVAGGDLPVIARVCATLGLDLTRLTEAEEQGLITVAVDSVAFTHPLARAAAYTQAPPDQRRAMHAAVADALPAGELDRRAWHRCSASLGPDESVAAALEEVGARSTARGAYSVAATAYEQAARLSDVDTNRAHRFLAAGEAAWFAGEDSRAMTSLEQATAVDPPARTRARATAVKGLVAARRGSLAEARDMLLSAADAAAEVDPQLALVMYAEAVDVCMYLLDTAGAQQAASSADRLVHLTAESDAPHSETAGTDPGLVQTRAAALASIAAGMADVFAGRSGAERIRAGVDYLSTRRPSPTDLQSAWEVLGPLFLRESGTGRDLVRKAVAQRRADVAVGALPHLLFHLARDDATTDQWARAEAGYGEAIALAREIGQLTELAASLAGLAWLAGRQGRADACRDLAAEAMTVATSRGVNLASAWARFAVAELDLSKGRASAAAEQFAELAEWLDRLGVLDVDLSPVPELVEALLRSGRANDGRQAASTYIDRAETKGQPWARARAARVRGMVGDADSEAAFEEALALHAATLDRFEEARTRLVFGEWLRRARRRVDARVQLRTALDTFERLGAQIWADLTLVELRATGVSAQRRTTGPVVDLTARELQIALLLAEGKTTRQAAEALFVSPKTVEYHLRHVYTKLGIGSRSELTDRMRGYLG